MWFAPLLAYDPKALGCPTSLPAVFENLTASSTPAAPLLSLPGSRKAIGSRKAGEQLAFSNRDPQT